MSWMMVFCVLYSGFADEPWQIDRPLPALKHGTEFRAALEQPISATWNQATLRDVVRRLSETQQLGLLLDCRIDPTTPVQLNLTDTPLLQGLTQLSQRCAAVAVSCGHTVYLGPANSAIWLRTTVAQRDLELEHDTLAIPKTRQSDLHARMTIHWSDFTTPREIVEQIARRYQLRIDHADLIPHDLWATATLPYATAAESLSLVLNPLELDFRWTNQGTAIEIVPWQIPATIERRFPLKKSQQGQPLLTQLRAEFPQVEGEATAQQLVLRGRVEDLEAVQAWLNPGVRPKETPPGLAAVLSKRQFTLKVENVPIRQILAELEKTSVQIEYDEAALAAAKIDLEVPVSLDVTAVSAEAFLTAVLKPLPLRFEIRDRTIRLTPQQP